MSDIEKYVRSDTDIYGTFNKSAVVDPNGGYTYEITVTDSTRPIKNVVVFDRLENASKDRKNPDGSALQGEIPFETTCWYGSFVSVMTDGLVTLGIEPVVYYNADRNAKLPALDGSTLPSTVLTHENGWYKASEWTQMDSEGNPTNVMAVAVDMSKTSNGEDYILTPGKSVSFRIHMKAPASSGGATWAYNNRNRQLTHRTTAKHPAEHWVWPGASLLGQRLLM